MCVSGVGLFVCMCVWGRGEVLGDEGGRLKFTGTFYT